MKKQKTNLDSALDELLAGKTTAEIVGPDGLLKQFNEEARRASHGRRGLTHSLGLREKHAAEGCGTGNNRNGTSRKKIQGDFAGVEMSPS